MKVLELSNVITRNNKSYHISYNPFSRDYGCSTTALVRYDLKYKTFLILKGCHIENYNKCKNLNECIEYFKSQKDLVHKYSDEIDGSNLDKFYKEVEQALL